MGEWRACVTGSSLERVSFLLRRYAEWVRLRTTKMAKLGSHDDEHEQEEQQ